MRTLNPARWPFRNGDRILFQGDSITDVGRNRQNDAQLGNGYTAVVKGLLSTLRPDLQVEVINRGCGGDRTPELLRRWESDCLALKPTWLSIMIGVNDVWRLRGAANGQTFVPLPDFVANYHQLLDAAVESGIPHLVLMSPTLIDKDLDSDLNRMLVDYNEAVKVLAKEYKAIYVPVRDRLVEVIQAYPEVDWLPDGCHPCVAGHTVIATTWLQALENACCQ